MIPSIYDKNQDIPHPLLYPKCKEYQYKLNHNYWEGQKHCYSMKYLFSRLRNLLLKNGDSKKLLLARSRYLLFKSADKWTGKQAQRDKLLFGLYPDILKAYSLTLSLRMIFSKNSVKDASMTRLVHWYNKVTYQNLIHLIP